MRISIRFLSIALCILAAATVRAQEEVPQYTVQIGSFVNPKPGDFAHLQNLGFVYVSKRPNNYADVFIGGYGTEAAANKTVASLKAKGYDNAFVSKLNVEGGQSVTVVQLATKSVGEKVDWEGLLSAERLFVLLNGNQIKIFTGTYPDVETAKAQVPRLEKLGFKGAFSKNVNNALLHEVTEFEAGGAAKKPLIPLDFAGAAAEQERIEVQKKQAETRPAETRQPETRADVPRSYDADVAIISPQKQTAPASRNSEVLTAKGVEVKEAPAKKGAAPEIRANVKRTSALEMQKVLKAEGSYKGSLDGFYGKGTKAAYDQELNSNRQLQKYRILSGYTAKPENDAPRGTLQFFVNNLWQDPKSALDGLEASKAPIAKAYRAYYLFANEGISQDVNTLMNQAIREAFANNKAVNLPRFDYKATYAYVDLDQLLLHIRYI
ncbi:MAG: SPOR domain-containing protein, partial [Bacteroidota bacterium]